jgi:hypothetical protein
LPATASGRPKYALKIRMPSRAKRTPATDRNGLNCAFVTEYVALPKALKKHGFAL